MKVYLANVKKIIFAAFVLPFILPYCLLADDEGVTLNKIPIDPSNILVVRCRIKQLPAPNATNPQPALPQGAHWGIPGNFEEQTYEVVLVNDKQESILESFQLTVPSVAVGVWMPERFNFFDSHLDGNKVYYVYIAKNTVDIVRLERLGKEFRRTKETSFPYDIKMGIPKFQDSQDSEIILKFSQYNNLFKEAPSGDFVEVKN